LESCDRRPTCRRLFCGTSGQDLIEYVLLAGFIALVALAGAIVLGTSLNGWLTTVAETIPGKKSNCSATGTASSGGKCL
jgi:Flp pilus assembly pilin Flp